MAKAKCTIEEEHKRSLEALKDVDIMTAGCVHSATFT